MEDLGQVLAVIEGLCSDDLTNYYNLFLTTRKFVFIHVPDWAVKPELGRTPGEWVGWAVARAVQKDIESEMTKKEDKSHRMTLNELMQQDEKNYAVNHEDITLIEVHKGWIHSELIVKLKTSRKIFSFNKNFKKILSALHQAPALAGKVSASR